MQPRPWYEEALRLVKADYYPAALEATNKAIGIEPGHAKAHRLRGLALSELDRHEEALDAYRQAIKLDPAMTYVQYQIAVELNRLGRHAEALAAADTSIGFNPDDTAPFILRGAILFDLGRYPEALDAFTSVLERRPDVWQVRFNRAHALDHARHHGAVRRCDRGVRGGCRTGRWPLVGQVGRVASGGCLALRGCA
jgi:tetratricopeptide (TPR) repeat protein